jgi:group I intron endonuclease
MMGIYKITNLKGKIYIGQSTDLKKREEMYLKLKCKGQPKLYNSLQKYGWEQHKFEIIEECGLEQLNEREMYWGLYYDVLGENGLNLRLGDAKGKCSEETKQKMSQSAIGRKWNTDMRYKFNSSKTNHPMYNEEWKNKISESLKGRTITWASKISKSSKGKKGKFTGKNHSEETKQHMSEYRKINYVNNHKKSSIIQYDLEGNFIKRWESITEAKQLYKGDIQACCAGKQKTAGGYKWTYDK